MTSYCFNVALQIHVDLVTENANVYLDLYFVAYYTSCTLTGSPILLKKKKRVKFEIVTKGNKQYSLTGSHTPRNFWLTNILTINHLLTFYCHFSFTIQWQ